MKQCACGTALGSRNKAGRCRPCAAREVCRRLNADPAVRQKASATIAKWTPEQRAAKVAHLQTRSIPPDEMERRRARGFELMATVLNRPDVVAKRESSRARAGRTRTESTIGHIPAERRDEYRQLVQYGHMSATEATEIILVSTPGTPEHARRHIENQRLVGRIKHLRDRAQRY